MINMLIDIVTRLSLMTLQEMKDRQQELQTLFREANKKDICADELNISIVLEAHVLSGMLGNIGFKQQMLNQNRR